MGTMGTTFGEDTRLRKENNETVTRWQKDIDNPATFKEFQKFAEKAVQASIRSHGGGDNSLRTRAWILAHGALKSFNPQMNASLNTHLHSQLQKLSRFHRKRSTVTNIPEQTYYDSNRVHKYLEEYKDKEGVEPNAAQIASGTGVSIKRIAQIRRGLGDEPLSKMTNDKGDITISSKETDHKDLEAFVYFDMNNRQKHIYERLTGFGGATPVKDKKTLASDLGISSAALSQNIGTLQKKFKKVFE